MPLAIVTGTSRGLGRALAERLLAAGWTVHGFSRQPDAWAPPGFVAHAVDVGDPAAVRAAVAAITAEGATIDLLVNNAGAAAMNALLLTPPETAAELMRVNYLGAFHCLQAVGKAMVRARRGRILNVTTVAVPLALEGEAAYVASKAAVEALTRVAARELAPQGVVVAAAGLGPVDTRLTRAVGADQLARLNRRIGRPAGTTLAEAADFLFRHATDPGLVGGSIHYLGELPLNMPARFIEQCARFGANPALIGSWGVVSYAALADLVDEARRALAALGLARPTTFAVLGGHGPAGTAWLLALAEAGHFAVPLAGNPAEHPAKLAEVNVQWVVATEGRDHRLLPRVTEPPAQPLLRALAARGVAGLVLFSSGTAGRPKAMAQDFPALLARYASRRLNHLPVLALLGFDHIGGLNTLFGTLATGAPLVVPVDRSIDAALAAIQTHRVAVLPATPTFLNLLLAAGAPASALASLRVITYGTEPMPESLLTRLRAALPQVRFIQTFGTSETGIFRTESPEAGSTFLKFDDPGLEWKVVEDELWLRSRTQVAGYLNASNERFTPEGWFRTGDRVEVRPDGALRILGRLGELINVGGEKLMPVEVEAVLLGVPGIQDCRVSGEPSPLTGQTVVADVVLAPGQDAETVRSALRRACRERLDRHKVPTKVRFVPAVVGERLKKTR